MRRVLKLEIEVEYEPYMIHGDTDDGIEWFKEAVLLNPEEGEGLRLYSCCADDFVGSCKVTNIISGLYPEEE